MFVKMSFFLATCVLKDALRTKRRFVSNHQGIHQESVKKFFQNFNIFIKILLLEGKGFISWGKDVFCSKARILHSNFGKNQLVLFIFYKVRHHQIRIVVGIFSCKLFFFVEGKYYCSSFSVIAFVFFQLLLARIGYSLRDMS